MIKINLLPVHAAKKKETAVQQIVIFVISVVAVAAIVLSMWTYRKIQISNVRNDITASNKKIEELKSKIGKLEELKTLKDQVKKKLDVLAELRKNKAGPAQRLVTLSDLTPDQVWLTNYAESGSDVRISGIAYNEDLIAKFMRAMDASNDFSSVVLGVSEQVDVGGSKLKKFDVTMKLRSAAAPSQPEVKK